MKNTGMAWVFLIVAGLLEIAWAIGFIVAGVVGLRIFAPPPA